MKHTGILESSAGKRKDVLTRLKLSTSAFFPQESVEQMRSGAQSGHFDPQACLGRYQLDRHVADPRAREGFHNGPRGAAATEPVPGQTRPLLHRRNLVCPLQKILPPYPPGNPDPRTVRCGQPLGSKSLSVLLLCGACGSGDGARRASSRDISSPPQGSRPPQDHAPLVSRSRFF